MTAADRAPEQRFSDRVADYVRARPGYPVEIVHALERSGALAAGAVVADLGSGTGISSRLLLDQGYAVLAVEPNAEMRAAAERMLGTRPGFRSIDGSAEATGLNDSTVDLVLAAQAFHWFDAPAARAEMARILRPGGRVALLWNVRRVDGDPFLEGYEQLLQTWAIDYGAVDHRRIGPADLAAFFGGPFDAHRFENLQTLDRDTLRARLFSSSYTPTVGHPHRAPMEEALEALFAARQIDGQVTIAYDVDLLVGLLATTG